MESSSIWTLTAIILPDLRLAAETEAGLGGESMFIGFTSQN
jgi:hypothetical protein